MYRTPEMLLLSLTRSRTVPTLFTSVCRVLDDSENASAKAIASPFERYWEVSESTCLRVAMLESDTVTEPATSSIAPLSFGRSRTDALPVPAVLLAVLVEVGARRAARLEREVRPG